MAQENDNSELNEHDELPEEHPDPFIRALNQSIRIAVKVLAILMVLVIFWSVIDVIYVIYEKLSVPPFLLLTIEDILVVFGAILAVLIGVEIFINIRLYLGSHIIPVQLVLGTALMAIARKIIVLDLGQVSAEQILGIGFVTLALGVSYWLVAKKT
ncbi:MAG: uncharacterized membrane protein (DUF373 family) [Oleiphilaceae bacterium]|jgi:uncharacterized membrane protein (DUF373 family)